jgi:DNA-binding XRE family transcriptional regulator
MSGPQIIKTPMGEEMVVLPKAEYDALLSQLDELEEDADDRVIYDARKAELGAVPPLPSDVSSAMLRGDRLLKALREWKGMTQSSLAKSSGISQGFLSDIESGKRVASADTLARIANALELPEAWLG